MEMLRFSTAGSVDDGKSTLIGRILYDSKTVFEDQLEAVARSSARKGTHGIDLSLITDGLAAEREQKITIDVAYRYFSTPKRKFIIADTPGHEQYTRNMVTGASTADLAIILVDARKGVLPQSKRHSYISALLGIPHIVVAVNKMDLVDYSETIFEQVKADFIAFTKDLGIKDLSFIPVSALNGDNIVNGSQHMPWFKAAPLLDFLETVQIDHRSSFAPLRFPVQCVIRPNLDFRGYAGQVASGSLRVGDLLMALPSRKTSRVKAIVTFDGNLETAAAGDAVTIQLTDEIDISRGDMLVHAEQLPEIAQDVQAKVCWMVDEPLKAGKKYLLKHTTQTLTALVLKVDSKLDILNMQELPTTELRLNEIGKITLKLKRPIYCDAYAASRATGSFILIDELSNATVGAGLLL